MEEFKEEEKIAKQFAALSLLSSILKIFGGYFSKTGALIADGFHSLIDFIEWLSSLIGIKLMRIKPSERFPYGLYKVENLLSLIFGILIIYASFSLVVEISKFSEINTYSLIFSAISLLVSAFIFLKSIKRRVRIESVKALLVESFGDLAISILIFLLILFRLKDYQKFVVFAITSIMIFFSLKIIYNSILAILDICPSRKVLEEVKRKILSIEGVKNIKDVKIRKSGPFLFGEITIEVPSGIPVDFAHEICDKIEESLKDILNMVIIHVEPYRERTVVAIPIEDGKIAKEFGRAKKFLIVNGKRKFIENPFLKKKVRRGAAVANFLKEMGVNAVIVREIGSVSFHTLRSLLIDIYRAESDDVEENLKKFFEGNLERLEKETRKRL